MLLIKTVGNFLSDEGVVGEFKVKAEIGGPIVVRFPITFLIWVLLFLLGIDVGGNDIIVKGLHTLGLEALIITLAAVIGSTLFAWGLWYLLYIRNRGKETKA